MTIKGLRITDTVTGYWVDASAEEAPELHEAWARWTAAEHGSSAEQHRWTAVLDAAQAYLNEIGCDGNEAGDVNVSPEV